MRYINMEGIEVNEELINCLKNFKQGAILESSYLRIQHVITKDTLVRNNINIADMITNKMIQELSSQIILNRHCDFEIIKSVDTVTQSISLIAMKASDLKHVVEYCIRTMPLSAIDEIRLNTHTQKTT